MASGPLAYLGSYRETLPLGSPYGRLCTVEGVRTELTLLLAMIADLDCAAIPHTLTPIHKPLDAMLVPFAQAEALEVERRTVGPHEVLDFLVLAWHHNPLVYQSGAKHKRSHQREREFWLACAAGL